MRLDRLKISAGRLEISGKESVITLRKGGGGNEAVAALGSRNGETNHSPSGNRKRNRDSAIGFLRPEETQAKLSRALKIWRRAATCHYCMSKRPSSYLTQAKSGGARRQHEMISGLDIEPRESVGIELTLLTEIIKRKLINRGRQTSRLEAARS